MVQGMCWISDFQYLHCNSSCLSINVNGSRLTVTDAYYDH